MEKKMLRPSKPFLPIRHIDLSRNMFWNWIYWLCDEDEDELFKHWLIIHMGGEHGNRQRA